jgi:hypothetical protein
MDGGTEVTHPIKKPAGQAGLVKQTQVHFKRFTPFIQDGWL